MAKPDPTRRRHNDKLSRDNDTMERKVQSSQDGMGMSIYETIYFRNINKPESYSIYRELINCYLAWAWDVIGNRSV